LSRGIVGNSGTQKVRETEESNKKERLLPKKFGVQASSDRLSFPLWPWNPLNFRYVKELSVSFKRKVERYQKMLEVGQTYGLRNVNSVCKPAEGEKALE
jgi:hypothetical protein